MSQNQEVLISCKKCTLRVPIGKTTYDKDGNSLICYDCYNRIAMGLEPKEYKTIQSADMPKRIHYKCGNCNFEFSRSEDFAFGGLCINCGKDQVKVNNKIIEIEHGKTLLDY